MITKHSEFNTYRFTDFFIQVSISYTRKGARQKLSVFLRTRQLCIYSFKDKLTSL